MDSQQFDQLATRFAHRLTRRSVLRAFIGTILGFSAYRTVEDDGSIAQASCGFFETDCGFASVPDCVDLSSDDLNCGYCGNRCGFGLTCHNGSCTCGGFGSEQTACPDALGLTTCVDLQTDEGNCGWCGNRCGFGLTCGNGVCGCGSGFGLNRTACSNSLGSVTCADLQTDQDNCGWCGNQCDFGLTCVDGQCGCRNLFVSDNLTVCPRSTLGVGSTCVKLNSDDDHCGSCGNQCDFGLTCIDGECGCRNLLATDNRVACPSSTVVVGSRLICVDLHSDDDHCGSCGNRCDFGCDCLSGTCDCEDGPVSGFPESGPTIGTDSFRSTTCGFEVSWQSPWETAADLSTEEYDAFALTVLEFDSDPVTLEFWGIPIDLLLENRFSSNSSVDPVLILRSFVSEFRKEFGPVRTIQEMNGRLPTIIEFEDSHGSNVREFIYGFATPGNVCGYVYVARVINAEFMPEEFRELEMLVSLDMDMDE